MGSLFHFQSKPVTRCQSILTPRSHPPIHRKGGRPAACRGLSSIPSRRPNALDPEGIDDWFVPAQAQTTDNQDNRSAPWTPETDAFFPNDWIYPDSWNAPITAAAPRPAPPAPGPQPNAPNPAVSNRPVPPRDLYAAYWSQIPASRLTALAWAPPVFPSSDPFSLQSTLASPWLTPPPLSPDSFGPAPSSTLAPGPAGYGMLGGIPKMMAEQAAANDAWHVAANGMLGGIPKMAASPASLSSAGSYGLLGALKNLQPAPSNAQAAPSYLLDPRPVTLPDPVPLQDDSPLSTVELVADKKTDKRNLELFDQRAFGTPPPLGSTAPRLVPPVVGRPPPSPPAPVVSPAQPPSLPSLPRGPAPVPGPPADASGAPAPIGAQREPAKASAGPSTTADGAASTPLTPSWRRFEQKHGSQQTTMRTIFQGQATTVRLDFPPDVNGIVDLKEYNWWKPGYVKPFLQGKITERFQKQIQKYQTIDPNVRFQFSEEPPSWVVQAIEQVGGTYFVKSDP